MGEAGRESAGDLWGMVKAAPVGIWHAIEHPIPDTLLHPIDTFHTDVQRALPIIDAYEKSRSGGKSVMESLSAANDHARSTGGITGTIAQKISDLQKNPTREGVRDVTDLVGILAASYGIGKVGSMLIPEEAATAALPVESETAATTTEVPTEFNSPTKPTLVQQVKALPAKVVGKAQRAVSPTAAAQPEAQSALRQGAVASTQDAGVTADIANAPDAGIRTLMTEPIAEAAKIEKGIYTTVNEAAGTDMKSLYDRQEELMDALDEPTNIGQKSTLQTELKTTQQQIATGEANVQTKLGKDAPSLIRQAKAATQQRFAMEAGDAKLFNNESVVKGNIAHGTGETINVDSAIKAAENLDKPSKFAPRGSPTRLQQMFGKDGAKAFKQGLYDAQKSGAKVLTRNKILAYLSGSGLGVGEIYRILN
jgi:hypothetical protein